MKHWGPETILDFGCGKSDLVQKISNQLNIEGFKYDPAIEQISQLTIQKADIVLNTDVLEHVYENEIDTVLSDISSVSSYVFFNIATAPASKILPNGENAHATVKPGSWWREKLLNYFDEVNQLPSKRNRVTFVTWPVRSRDFRRFKTSKLNYVNVKRLFKKK